MKLTIKRASLIFLALSVICSVSLKPESHPFKLANSLTWKKILKNIPHRLCGTLARGK